MADIAVDNFETLKSFYPTLNFIQTTSHTRIRSLQEQKPIDWNEVVPADFESRSERSLLPDLTPCQTQIGIVIFDVVALAVGAAGLRIALREATIRSMARAVAPVLEAIQRIIGEAVDAAETLETVAYRVIRIIEAIWNGGCFSAVWDVFLGNLTWYNALIYGVSGAATIAAAVGTGGLALAAEIVLLLIASATLGYDINVAIGLCKPQKTPTPPTPALDPDKMPIKASVAIQTASGNYITVMNNGGFATPGASIMATDRRKVGPWEQFKLVPLDMKKKTFALKTHDGHYLTATEGGGFGGPNDVSSPIQTNRTQIGPWEKLILIKQPNETYAISTTSGYYLTALGGGGRGGANNASSIIHTDATHLNKDETFTLHMLPQ